MRHNFGVIHGKQRVGIAATVHLGDNVNNAVGTLVVPHSSNQGRVPRREPTFVSLKPDTACFDIRCLVRAGSCSLKGTSF